AAEAGLAFDAAFENEFYLAYRRDDGFIPVDRSLCFSAIGMESTEPVIQDIIAALTDQGLTVELSHPELGHGQQELSIRHAPAVTAADNQVTYRQTVRAVAEGSTNLELKASDNSSNPYIALGGVIAAALDGISRELDPGDPIQQDPGNLTDEERELRGVRRFPTTSKEALDELERDEVLM